MAGEDYGICCPCCCLLDCLCDCGCCVLGCLFQIISTLLITLGLLILIIWLILRPHGVKFHVTYATLSEFNFTSNNTLTYNLALNLTARNPNKFQGVYYREIEAQAIYAGHGLESVEIAPFYQRYKNTTLVGPGPVVFKGQSVVVLDEDEKTEFDKESGEGVYGVRVKVDVRVKYKCGLFNSGIWKIEVNCDLNVPFVGNSNHTFERTKCH